MRLLVVSEGARDVGDTRGAREGGEGERKGAVSVLVRRVLEAKFGREIGEWEIERDALPRVHARSEDVSGYERKVFLAIQEAAARGCSSVAIVVDRDRTDGTSRLAKLRGGRTMAENNGQPLAYKTALGVAVETVEAWLLADEKAITEALGLHPPASAIPDPESLNGRPGTDKHPKKIFEGLIERAGARVEQAYDDVAQHVRLDVLEERCATGFAPFAEEIRQRCS